MFGYKEVVFHAKKRATAQIAHLVFADTQANAEKPKELFFSQRSTEVILNKIKRMKLKLWH